MVCTYQNVKEGQSQLPKRPTVGKETGPTFDLRRYDAKVKFVGASIKVWEQATVAKTL